MSLKRFAIALPLSLAILGLASVPAWADDDEPAPKRVRIKLKTKPTEPAPAPRSPKSPMAVLQQWLMGKVGETLAGEATTGRDALDAWFKGGSDVPLADLRDALKAEGWTGASMRLWLMGEMARQAPRMMRMFRMHDAPGDAAPRTFPWFGPDADPRQSQGGFAPKGHGQGMRRGRRFSGRRFGPRGFRRQGFRGQGFRGQGLRGRGFNGEGWQGPGFRGRGFHGQGFQGQGMPQPGDQTQRRAFILWNDGSGWQQRELPGGIGHGGQGHGGRGLGGGAHGIPGLGGMPGAGGPTHGGWGPGRGAPPGMPGAPGGSGPSRPRPGAAPAAPRSINHHRMNIQGLETIRELLRGLQSGDGTTLDPAMLQKLLEALKPQGAALGDEVPAPTAGRKVHVKLAPKGRVEVIEEVEIEEVGPGR